jgi:NAD(P)H-hydrate epimerase
MPPAPIPVLRRRVPSVTAEQMAEVDRLIIEDIGITLAQMMENAGRNLAWLARTRWSPRRVTALVGTGGNAGGVLVAARHLHNRGCAVTVTLTHRDRLSDVPAAQLAIAERLGIEVVADPEGADLILDGIIGYSLVGDPRGRAAEIIGWANHNPSPILSLDVPSGFDAATGTVGSPCIRAAATLSLALPKSGVDEGGDVFGERYLGDISVPPSVYQRIGIHLDDPFAAGPVVSLDG